MQEICEVTVVFIGNLQVTNRQQRHRRIRPRLRPRQRQRLSQHQLLLLAS